MKLESLELTGFKSFAQKTKFSFHEGLTEIVGPNGSGKSNIIEAIRWVLGEKSAKNLRGEKMPDIIFSGSSGHNSLNRAIVKLTFDNSDHYINIDYTELSIAREIFKNGESNYYINNKICRLKDINNLFMDSGIGQGSFSIISQGNVENIFNSKPEDRRYIVETLAGIYKYKNQKQETNAKLDENNRNLIRINDIIHELKVQVNSLNEQKDKANQYLQLKQQLGSLNKSKLIYSYHKSLSDINNLQLEISTTNDSIDILKGNIKTSHTNLNDFEKSIVDKNTNRELLQAKLIELTKQQEIITGKNNLSQQEILFNKRQLQEFNVTLTNLKKEKTKIINKLNTNQKLSKEIKHFNENIDLKSQQNTLNHLDFQIKSINQKQNKFKNLQLDLISKLSNAKNKFDYLSKDRKKTEKILSEKNQSLINTKNQINILNNQLNLYKKADDAYSNEISLRSKKINSLQDMIVENKHALNVTKNKWYDSIKDFQSKKSQLDNLKSNNNHLTNIAKYLAENNLSGIIGIVVDFIDIDSKYLKAINTALGNKMKHIIVESSNDAKNAIAFLAKNKLGRTTFLPKNELIKHSIDDSNLNKLSNILGYVGVADELISMPSSLQKVKKYLLGNILVAENLETAVKISKLVNYRYKVVTLHGEIVNAGGSITGGVFKHEKSSLLDLKQKISLVQKQFKNDNNKMLDYEKKIETLDLNIKKAEKSIQSLKNVLDENSKKSIKVKSKIDNAIDKINNFNRDLRADNLTIKRLSQDLNDSNEYNVSIIDDYENQINDNKIVLVNYEKNLNDLSEERKKVQTCINDMHSKILLYNEKSANYELQRKDLNNQLETINNKMITVDNSKNKLDKKISNSVINNNSEEKLKHIVDQIKEVNSKLKKLDNSVDDFNHKIELEKNKLSKINDKVLNKSINLNKLKLKNNTLKNNLFNIKQKLQSEYNFTPEAEHNLEAIDLQKLNHKVNYLESSLKQMGSVNIQSIQEYKNVSERLEFLTQQSDDLKSSQNQLEKTMAQIDKEVVNRFKYSFDNLNDSFKKVFQDIFGGGKAKLLLTDPDDILNTGIDIMVQPPGKKYRNINLLSGGEKSLAAISLLFAVLKVKPVPFCILDEAESFLDSSNVDRFAKYICKLKQETQFIVITHRKETMMYADTLSGITMQDSGISKLVSVNFDKIVSKKEN
ncbi:chromosome segregation protein SMC [Apilactobacillus xinyiensis]|uniref:chromosome segregation protein SMC n=1 Tax=Apilactobacillus xinyiensis TaxID=2841032 RepID=UPI001C7DB1EF|nr:chromosome segregation protein SMC [Apilactobacillus xinyiensis]MCL0318371.1 chromosome segregation protein SMC [Apilactobacillus xinyiensis]